MAVNCKDSSNLQYSQPIINVLLLMRGETWWVI